MVSPSQKTHKVHTLHLADGSLNPFISEVLPPFPPCYLFVEEMSSLVLLGFLHLGPGSCVPIVSSEMVLHSQYVLQTGSEVSLCRTPVCWVVR